MESIPIVFLWAEVTGYVKGTLDALSKADGVSIDVVHWDRGDINSTQYRISESSTVHFHGRSMMNDRAVLSLLTTRQPQIIVVSGWMDKGYIWACRRYKKTFPNTKIVAGLDGQWTGSIRQRFGQLYYRIFYRNLFEFIWVSGKPQYSLAQRLGYGINDIISNLYSADTNIFAKRSGFCKRFVFVGRFVPIKALDLLVDAYSSLPVEKQIEWPLILIGDGEWRETILNKDNRNIVVMPFLQPEALQVELQKGGVGCLTSHRDNWGVVIHEFALMGFPLLLSTGCGAATEFLIPGYNGYLFKKGDRNALYRALNHFTLLTADELRCYSESSMKLGARISTDLTASSLLSVRYIER